MKSGKSWGKGANVLPVLSGLRRSLPIEAQTEMYVGIITPTAL